MTSLAGITNSAKSLVLFLVLFLVSQSSLAADIFVMNTNDNGAGSLRQAIIDANASPGADDIFLWTVSPTISLASDLPAITESVAIYGPGSFRLTIDGNGNQVFLVNSAGVNLSIEHLSIIGGATANEGAAVSYDGDGSLTLKYVHFEGNLATSFGGAVYTNGDATVHVESCSFLSNNGLEGGGLYVVSNNALVDLIHNTFTDNVGSSAGPNGSAVHLRAATNVYMAHNTVVANGGTTSVGVFVDAASVLNYEFNVFSLNSNADLENASSTVTTLELNVVSNGINDIENGGPSVDNGAGLTINPMADNGGAVPSIEITGAPVIDGAGASTFIYDTRGFERPGAAADLGAFEVGSAASVASDIAEVLFGYATITDPAQYVAGDLDNTGDDEFKVAEFQLRDGGGSDDTDDLPTYLIDIGLDFTNHSNLERVALYQGSYELGEQQVTGSSVVFSGLYVIAHDFDAANIDVFVTFKTDGTVVEGDVISVSTSDAALTVETAHGSDFTSFGTIPTTLSGTENEIDVVPTEMHFAAMDVFAEAGNNFNVDVALVDTYGNVDFDDNATNVQLLYNSGPGSLSGGALQTMGSSLSSWSDVNLSADGTYTLITSNDGGYNEAISPDITIATPSVLSPGSIAFSMYNSSSDRFAFMAVEPINAGTEIHFMDHGWDDDSGDILPNSEGTITFTATENIPAGEQIVVTAGAMEAEGLSLGATGIIDESTDGGFNLAAGGDQILAFQGTVDGANSVTVTTFLAGIHADDGNLDDKTGWTGNASSTNESELPSQLTIEIDAISLFYFSSEQPNAVYAGPLDGSFASIGVQMNDLVNWSSGSTDYDIGDLSAVQPNTSPPTSGNISAYTGTGRTRAFDSQIFPFTDPDGGDVLQSLTITDVSGLSSIGNMFYDGNLDGINSAEDVGPSLPLTLTRTELEQEYLKVEVTGATGSIGTFSFSNVSDGDNTDGNTYTFTANLIDNALFFNDGATTDNFVFVPYEADFDAMIDFTIEGWFYFNEQQAAFLAGRNSLAANGDFNLTITVGGTTGVDVNLNANSGGLQTVTSSELALNTWYHIAGVKNGTNLELYVNGQLDGSGSVAGAPVTTTSDIQLGESGASHFDGIMEEIRIWNVARVASALQSNAPLTIFSHANLVAAYDFNSGNPGQANPTEDHLEDVSGNGHDGTLNNFNLAGTSNWITATVPAVVIVDPNSFDYGNVQSGTPSSAQTFSVVNIGRSGVTGVSPAFSGTDAADFSIDSDSGEGSLNPGASRAIEVIFTPGAVAARTGSLDISTNELSDVSAALSGTGLDGPPSFVDAAFTGLTTMEIRFDEDVFFVSPAATSEATFLASLTSSHSFGTPTIDNITSNVITINFTNPISDGAFSVSDNSFGFDGTTLEDASNNPSILVSTENIADGIAPVLNLVTAVSNTLIHLQYSEDINGGSLLFTDGITVTGGGLVTGIALNVDNSIVEVSVDDLAGGATDYTGTLVLSLDGDDIIEDVAGNSVAGGAVGIADGQAPVLLSAAAVSNTLVQLQYSEDIDGGSLLFTDGILVSGGGSVTSIGLNADNSIVELTIDDLAAGATDYIGTLDITLDAGDIIEDATGNISAGDQSSFPIADGQAPVLLSATAVSNTLVQLQYSEDIDGGSLLYTDGILVSGGGSVISVGLNADNSIVELTIDDLAAGATDYTGTLDITLDAGDIIEDATGNISAGDQSSFPIADGQAPVLLSATAVSNTLVQLQYSEDIDGGSLLYTDGILVSGGGSVISVGLNADNSIVELTIDDLAAGATDYTGTLDITLDADDIIEDASSNLSASDETSFPIADGQAPVLLSATAVSNTLVELQYSEDIDGGSLLFTDGILVSGGGSVTSIGLNADNSIVELTIDDLAAGATDYIGTLDITLDAGDIIEDATGNISAGDQSSFPIADGQAPVLLSATAVSNTLVQLQYSEDIDGGSLLYTDGILVSGGGSVISVGLNADNSIVELTIDDLAAGATDYTGTLDITLDGDDIIEDASANLSAGDETSFPIGDGIAPTLLSITIMDTEATPDGFIDQIVFTFSENIDTDDSTPPSLSDLGTITLPDDVLSDVTTGSVTDPMAGTNIVTLSNILSTDYNSEIENTAIGVTDLVMGGGLWVDASGNPLAAIVSSSTTVIDGAAPALIASVPADNSLSFNPSSNMTLSFSENVVAGTGNISLNGIIPAVGLVEGFDITSDVVISGNTITIDPAADLTIPNEYALQIASTAVVDGTSNAYAGISNDDDLDFIANAIAPGECSHVYAVGNEDSDGNLSPSSCNTAPTDVFSTSDTQLEAISVLYFNILNGTNSHENVSGITIRSGNTDIDWTAVIAGAELINEFGVSEPADNINADNIVFTPATGNGDLGDLVGNDDEVNGMEYALRVWFRTDLLGEAVDIDGKSLIFTVQHGDMNAVDRVLNAGGTAFEANATRQVSSGAITFNVDATEYRFFTVTDQERAVSFTATLEATDENGNRDLDYDVLNGNNESALEITTTGGSLVEPSVSITGFTAGLATTDNITFSLEESAITLSTANGDLSPGGDDTSNTFDVNDTVDPTFATAYYFDTDGNGIIDEIAVGMDEPMDGTTATSTGFQLNGNALAITGVVNAATANNVLDVNDTDAYITLTVDEGIYNGGVAANGGTAIGSEELTYVGGATFEDLAGNNAAATGTITENDAAAPVIADFSPANGDPAVDPNSIFVFTFSEDVQAQAVDGVEILFVDDDVPPNFIQIDVTDPTKVSVSGNDVTVNFPESLLEGRDYYVVIDAGSFTEDPAAVNSFAGLLNSTDYTFTVGGDTNGPLMLSAAATSTTQIEVTFNEGVAITSGLPATDFILTDGIGNVLATQSIVNGTANDNKLLLNFTDLDLGVGDFVLTYSATGSIITDLAAIPNPMVDDAVGVPVNYDVTPPALSSGVAVGTTQIDVTFTDRVQITNLEPGDFTVEDGIGNTYNVTNVVDATIEDAILELTVDDFTLAVGDLTVTYDDDDDTGDIEDFGGNFLLDDATGIIIDIDVTVPALLSASENTSTQLYVFFDDAVQILNAAPSGDFIVRDGINNAYAVTAILDGTPNDNRIELTVTDVSAAVGDLTITYSKSTTNIEDFGSNGLATDLTGVVIDKDAIAPLMTSVAARPNNVEVVITFNDRVQFATPVATDFVVADGINTGFTVTAINDETPNDNELVLTVNDFSSAIGDITVTYASTGTVVSDFGSNILADDAVGQVIDYDQTDPAFASGVPNGTTQIDVTFTDAVQISTLEAADFTVVDGIGTSFNVTNVLDGTINNATLELIVADFASAVGDLTLTYDDDDDAGDIEDFGGNFLKDDAVGINIDTDNTDPGFNALVRNSTSNGTPDNTNDVTISYNIEFDERIDPAEFTLDDVLVLFVPTGAAVNGVGASGLTAGNSAFGGAISLSGPTGPGLNIYTITLNNVSGNGDIGMRLLGSGISDYGGNQFLGGATTDLPEFVIDNDLPTLSSISLSTSGVAGHASDGQTISLTFTASDDLVTDPSVAFSSGGNGVFNGVSIDNSSAPTYTASYVVNALNDTEGDVTFTIDFTDDAGNAGAQVTAVSDASEVEVDFVVPSIEALEIISDNMTDDQYAVLGDEVTILVDFNDELLAAPSLTQLYSGGAAINDPSPSITEVDAANNIWEISYIVNALDTDGAVTFLIDFTDDAGNVGTQISQANITNGSSMMVDKGDPTLDDLTLDAPGTNDYYAKENDIVTIDLDFNEDLIEAPDVTIFVGGAPSFGTVNVLDLSDGDESTWQVTYQVHPFDTEGVIAYNIGFIDLAGNMPADVSGSTEIVSGVNNTNSITVDKTVPVISSIARKTPAAERNKATSVVFEVTFDSYVYDVATGDFSTTIGAVGSMVATTPGFVFDVTITGVSGDGLLDLDVVGGIVDIADNPVNITPLSEETYTIDNTAPVIASESVFVEDSDVTISAQLSNEVGVIHYLIVERTNDLVKSGDPLVADVADSGADDDYAGTGGIFVVDGSINVTSTGSTFSVLETLNPNNVYDIYLVAEDVALGNLSALNNTLIDVQTGGTLITAPVRSDVCIAGDAYPLTDIVITEQIENDFKTGTNRTLRLELPDGFTFNTSVGSVSGPSNNISAISMSVLNTYVQVTYTINGSNLIDQITVSGLEVYGTGSSEQSNVSITRSGSGDMYLANESDGRVFGDLSNLLPFNAPQIALANPADGHPFIMEADHTNDTNNLDEGNTQGNAVGSYTVNKITGNLTTTRPFAGFTMNATDDLTIYSDEGLSSVLNTFDGATSHPVSLDDLGLTVGDLGVTNFWITVTDGNSCESAATKYSVAIVNGDNSAGETVFTEEETAGTTITLSKPAGHTAVFVGNGLVDQVYGATESSARFVPSIAGSGGAMDLSEDHTIEYFLTASDGVQAKYSTTFTVTKVQTVLTAGSDVTFCYVNTPNVFVIDQHNPTDLDDTTDDGIPDFYNVQAWFNGENISAHVLSGPTPMSGTPTATTGWTFNPVYDDGDALNNTDSLLAAAGGTITLRKIVQNESTLALTTFATEEIFIYPMPIVTNFANGDGDGNFDGYYCEDGSVFDITRDLEASTGDKTGVITEGYTLYYDQDGNGNYIDDGLIYDFTATGTLKNNFDPKDPDNDGLTYEDESEYGLYRLEYTTGVLPSSAEGCEVIIQANFEIRPKPAMPALTNDFAGTQSGISDGVSGDENFFLEFCAGNDVIPDLETNGAGLQFDWYDNSALNTLLHTGTTYDMSDDDGGITNTRAAQTADYYLVATADINIDGMGFEGCASLARGVDISIYDVPAVPVLTNGALTGSNKFEFEYCVDDDTPATLDVIQLSDSYDDDEDTESYFELFASDMTTSLATITGTDFQFDPNAYLATVGYNPIDSTSYTFYISQTDHNNNFPAGSQEFVGCEGGMVSVTFNVNLTPSAPDIDDFGGDYSDSGIIADTVKYFICEGDAIRQIETPSETGSVYEWALSDGAGGSPGTLIDDVTTADDDIDAFGNRLVTEQELVDHFGYDKDTPGDYVYYVRQYTNANEAADFVGCPSEWTTVKITVFPDPEAPVFAAHTGDLDAGLDMELSVCEGDLLSLTTEVAGNVGQYLWYSTDENGNIPVGADPVFSSSTGVTSSEVTGDDLRLTTANPNGGPLGDGTYYFKVSQVNNINSGGLTYDGCETEEADMAVLRIHVLDIPSAPTEVDNDPIIYYCFGDEVQPIQVTDTGADIFYWYNDEDEVGTPSERLTVADARGVTIQASELIPNETGAPADLTGTSVPVGTYTFYVTQVTGQDGSSFVGCESNPRQVVVQILETPDEVIAPHRDAVCDVDAIPTLVITNPGSGSTFRWYTSSSVNPLTDTPVITTTSGSPNFTPNQTQIDAVITDYVAPFYVFRIEDIDIDGEGFLGCTSVITQVNDTIYDKPVAPTIVGTDIANEYVFCEDTEVLSELFEISGPGVDTVYTWYTSGPPNNPSGLISTGTSVSFNQVAALTALKISNVNNASPETTRIFVTQLTNNTCESDAQPVDVTVNPLPDLDITYTDEPISPETNEFCVSDGVGFTITGLDNLVPVSSGMFKSYTTDAVTSANLENVGLTDNGNGSANFNPSVAHLSSSYEEFGDVESSHDIVFIYTNTYSCTDSTALNNDPNETIEVNPLPDLEIYSTDLLDDSRDFLTSVLNTGNFSTAVCESHEDFIVTGQRNTTAGGVGQIYINGSPVNTTRIGSEDRALFQPRDLASAITGGSLVHPIRYEYTNAATGCSASLEKEITVHVLPEVFAIVNGGCIDPNVAFDVQLLSDNPAFNPPRNSPFGLDEMDYTWKFYEAKDGIIQFDSEFPGDDFSPVKEGQQVQHNFAGFTGLSSQFGIVLEAQHSTTGCISDQEVGITERTLLVRIDPNTSAVWEGGTDGQITSFYVNELLLNLDQIDSIKITDITEGTVIYNSADSTGTLPIYDWEGDDVFGPFNHRFDTFGLHELEILVTNSNGCDDFLLREVNVLPHIVVDQDGYTQSFDGVDTDQEGWYVEKLKDGVLFIPQADSTDTNWHDDYGINQLRESSWAYQALDATSIGGAGLSGSEGWITGSTGTYGVSEDSWLYSPAFNVSDLDQPMVSFSMIHNFDGVRDGVVMQYSLDDGLNWTVLGSYDDDVANITVVTGLNWYNSDQVGADPGQAFANGTVADPMGWAGAPETVAWVTAKHKLDEIDTADREFVRFRFALASSSEPKSDGYFGFALDDFRIFERQKRVLIENFISTSNESTTHLIPSTDIHREIDEILNGEEGNPNKPAFSSGDEIVIDYHIDLGESDPFNEINPKDPGARRTFYNVDNVTSVLDGGIRSSETDQNVRLPWTNNDFNLSSLEDPGVTITVADNGSSSSEIRGTVSLEALKDFNVSDELLVYVAVIEEEVIYEEGDRYYINGLASHTNVLRKMLPDAAGHFIKFDVPISGDPENPVAIPMNGQTGGSATLDIQWDMVNIKDGSELAVVVFVQDNKTKQILQALRIRSGDADVAIARNKDGMDDGSLVTGLDELRNMDFTLYPNPSNQRVTVSFSDRVGEQVEWVLFDQSGRVYSQGSQIAGFETFEINTNDFPMGMYYLSVKGATHEFRYKKLMIVH